MDFSNPKKSATSTEYDVSSKLPEELIYSILERLPIEDAVRTSVLSKQWRYIWTTISCCDDFTPFQLLHSNDLDTVHVFLLKSMIKDVQRVERFSLVMMLSKMSNIVSFAIDGYFLKVLGLEKSPKWLPHALKCVKKLEIESLNFGDLDQVQGVLCMLRNSPNLEVLRVAYMQMGPDDADLELTSSYLESPDCLPQKMLRLHSVEITSLEGSKPELLFIKLLLSRSRHLEDMIIQPSTTADVERRLSILKDIMFFPHASNKAKIAFLE